MRKPALWFLAGALATATLLFAQDAAGDWADRFSRWTATRDADAPVRNALHLRHTITLTNLSATQSTFYTVPANRRLLFEQMAVYCNFGVFTAARVDQLHVSALVGGTVARYPITRLFFDTYREFIGGPLRLYADPETPVILNLVLSHQTNSVCEVTATGQLVPLSQ